MTRNQRKYRRRQETGEHYEYCEKHIYRKVYSNGRCWYEVVLLRNGHRYRKGYQSIEQARIFRDTIINELG